MTHFPISRTLVFFMAFVLSVGTVNAGTKDADPDDVCVGSSKPTEGDKPVPTNRIWIEVPQGKIKLSKQKDGTLLSGNSRMDSVLKKHEIVEYRKVFKNSKRPRLKNVVEFVCKKNCDVAKFKDQFQSAIGVKVTSAVPSEPRDLLNPNDLSVTWPSTTSSYSDTEEILETYNLSAPLNYDYSLHNINAPAAWSITQGSSDVIVGVSEEGVDNFHPELAGKIAYISPNVLQPSTYSYTTQSALEAFIKKLKHGTVVGIVIAGKTNNSFFKSSIGYNTRLAYYGRTYDELLAAAYSGIKIINISWGTCTPNEFEQEAIDEIHSQGVFLVAAAGDGGDNTPPINIQYLWANGCNARDAKVYPASYQHVFSVTSVNMQDYHHLTSCSCPYCHQHNSEVDLAAPGLNVPVSSTDRLGAPYIPNAVAGTYSTPAHRTVYFMGVGTSISAGLVSGSAALMLAVNPNLSPDSMEKILKDTSANITAAQLQKCPNKPLSNVIGVGRLNAGSAVNVAQNYLTATISVNAGCAPNQGSLTAVAAGGTPPYSYSWSNGSTASSLSNLNPGEYSVTVTDATGLAVSSTATLPVYVPPQEISGVTAQLTKPTANQSNGAINITVGGTPPFSYSWSNGATTEDLTNVPAGIYTVIIKTVSRGCVSKRYKLLNQFREVGPEGVIRDNVEGPKKP